MNSTTRQSNIELIRVIAILFIIAHHLLVHGMSIWDNPKMGLLPLISSDALFFIGVNLFILISGYCGIKFRWKKLFYIWLLCALVGGVSYFVHLYIDNSRIGRSVIFNTVFSISNTPGTWYVREYVFLMILSPMINTALYSMTKKQILFSVGALTIISVYFGWFWKNEVNRDGYNLINFIWIYVIGFCLRKFYCANHCKTYFYMVICIICSMAHSILFLVCPGYVAWAYNNPLIVISAVSFFLFVVSFNFQNYWINRFAESTLVVYLIHENCYVSSWLYKPQIILWFAQNIWHFLAAVFGIYLVCVFIDLILRRGMVNNAIKYIYPIMSNSVKRMLYYFK